MSATLMTTDPALNLPQPEAAPLLTCQSEVESAECVCCGLTEDCTVAYINNIRERFSGKWVCGLCSEAVKDEMVRADRLISTEEALTRHLGFCKKFSGSPPVNSAAHLISAMRRILRRGLESGSESGSVPGSPVKSNRTALIQSESGIATLAGVHD